MNRLASSFRALLVPMALTAIALPLFGTGSDPLAAEAEMQIEVTIKDKEYHVKGQSLPGELTAIVIRNQDTVTHGFSSSLFKDVPVRKEGDAVEVKNKGVKSFHVDPGKTAMIYFTKGHSSARGTMQYPFWCDIHSNMKGEFLIVETTGAVGGG
jgi:plastocyanin